MVLKPPAPRHSVEETQDGLRITLYSKRSVITLITAIIGTVFGILFFFGAVSVFVVALVSSSQSRTEAHPDIIVGCLNLFFFFVLVFIFAFIGKILYEIFWMFWGREEIEVNTRTFSYFRRIGKWKRTRIFGLENVKDLRVNLIQQSGIFSPFYQKSFPKVWHDCVRLWGKNL